MSEAAPRYDVRIYPVGLWAVYDTKVQRWVVTSKDKEDMQRRADLLNEADKQGKLERSK